MDLGKFQSYKNIQEINSDKCFIFGSGTSLDLIIKSKNFAKIEKYAVITVNASILLFNWEKEQSEKYWISNDSSVRFWSWWKNVKESKCKTIIRNSWLKYENELPDHFYMFWPRINDLNLKDNNGLCFMSSIPTSIDLALQLGYKEIYLLGVDHYFKDNKSYFWELDSYKDKPFTTRLQTSNFAQNNMFQENMRVYKALNKYAEDNNAKIYNCSLNSKVDCFEKINFEELEL